LRVGKETSLLSDIPCADVLSVPGFFAKRLPFLLGGRLFPEVRKVLFLGERPILFDVTNRTVVTHDGA